MKFNSTKESSVPFDRAKGYVWLVAAKACEKTNFGRLLGLPVFIVTEVIDVPQRVARAGETIFKGAANMAAAPWTKDTQETKDTQPRFFRGVKQIFSLIPQAIQILASPLRVAVRSVSTPATVVFGGAKCARKEAADYGVYSFCKPKEQPPAQESESQDPDNQGPAQEPSEEIFIGPLPTENPERFVQLD